MKPAVWCEQFLVLQWLFPKLADLEPRVSFGINDDAAEHPHIMEVACFNFRLEMCLAVDLELGIARAFLWSLVDSTKIFNRCSDRFISYILSFALTAWQESVTAVSIASWIVKLLETPIGQVPRGNEPGPEGACKHRFRNARLSPRSPARTETPPRPGRRHQPHRSARSGSRAFSWRPPLSK